MSGGNGGAGEAASDKAAPGAAAPDAHATEAVTADEVRRIAALARLRPDAAAVGALARDLNRILEHMAALADADVSEVEGPVRLPDEPVSFREPALEPDALEEGAPGDRAPRWEAGFFVVPRLPGVDGGRAEGS